MVGNHGGFYEKNGRFERANFDHGGGREMWNFMENLPQCPLVAWNRPGRNDFPKSTRHFPLPHACRQRRPLNCSIKLTAIHHATDCSPKNARPSDGVMRQPRRQIHQVLHYAPQPATFDRLANRHLFLGRQLFVLLQGRLTATVAARCRPPKPTTTPRRSWRTSRWAAAPYPCPS